MVSQQRRGQLPEYILELTDEELFRITVLPPPAIFGFEPALCLIEQNDLHDRLDTAPSIPTRPFLGPRRNQPVRDRATRAARHALRRSTRRQSRELHLLLCPAGSWAHPGPAVRSSPGSCVCACPSIFSAGFNRSRRVLLREVSKAPKANEISGSPLAL